MMLLFLTLSRLNVIQRLKLQKCSDSPGILISTSDNHVTANDSLHIKI